MIIKDLGQIQLACDDCGSESPAYEEDEFEAMIASAKADGWQITRPEGKWEHRCCDCSKAGSALAAARRKFGLR